MKNSTQTLNHLDPNQTTKNSGSQRRKPVNIQNDCRELRNEFMTSYQYSKNWTKLNSKLTKVMKQNFHKDSNGKTQYLMAHKNKKLKNFWLNFQMFPHNIDSMLATTPKLGWNSHLNMTSRSIHRVPQHLFIYVKNYKLNLFTSTIWNNNQPQPIEV